MAFAGYPLVAQDRVTGVMAMFAREPLLPEILDALGSIAGGIGLKKSKPPVFATGGSDKRRNSRIRSTCRRC